MDNPAVLTFCRDSLRSCYTILGREGFKAEVDYLLRCYAGVGSGATEVGLVPRCQRPGDEQVSIFAAAQPAVGSVAASGAGCQRQEENAVSRRGSDLKVAGAGAATAATAVEETPVSKWTRKAVPDEERCQRIAAYNGTQCSFRAVEGTDFCSRHTEK